MGRLGDINWPTLSFGVHCIRDCGIYLTFLWFAFADFFSLQLLFWIYLKWRAAYYRIRSHRYNEKSGLQDFKKHGWKFQLFHALNWSLVVIGIHMFGLSTYTTLQSIIKLYQEDAYCKSISCKSIAIRTEQKETKKHIHSKDSRNHHRHLWL